MSNSVNINLQSLIENINSGDANDAILFYDNTNESLNSVPYFTYYDDIGYPTISFVSNDTTVISRVGSLDVGGSSFFAVTRDAAKTGSASIVFESGFVTDWLLGTDNGGNEDFNIYNFGESSFQLSLTINKSSNRVGISTLSASQIVVTNEDNYLNSVESIEQSQVTDLITDLNSKLNLSGGTMTGDLILNSDPSSSLQAATKQYVDNAVAGLNFYVVTGATFDNNPVIYNNGSSGIGATLTSSNPGQYVVDGVNVVLGQEYLFKDQTSSFQNGIYTCTNTGGIGIQAVFTRATNYDTVTEITPGDSVFVTGGNTNKGSTWIQTQVVTTIGTDPIDFIAQGGTAISLVGDVTGSGYSPVNTTIANGAVVLTTKVSGILPYANGGMDPSAQSVGGILYTTNTPDVASNSNFTFNGLNTAILTSPTTTTSFSVVSAVTGSTNNAIFSAQRGDQSNGSAQLRFFTSSTQQWQIGLRPADALLHFYDAVNSTDRMTIDASGNINIPLLTASYFVFTDSSKNLTSTPSGVLPQTNGGTNSSGSYNALGVVFQNSGNTAFTTTNTLTYNGSNLLQLSINNAFSQMRTSTALTGSSNTAGFIANRGDQANGVARTQYTTASTANWSTGLRPTDASFHIYDEVNTTDRMIIDTSGNVNIPSLTASSFVFTDSSKNLTSTPSGTLPIANGGTNNSSALTNNGITYYNGTSITNDSTLTYSSNELSVNSPTVNVVVGITVDQTFNGVSTGNAFFRARTRSSSGGDPYSRYTVTGSYDWSAGCDNSDSGSYVISNGAGPGINNRIRVTTAGDVTISTGDLFIGTVNKGLNIKSAAVSAGTANASFVTSVVLVAGTVTVNNSFVTTSCTGCVAVVTSGGTPGTGYRLNIGSGTFTVTSSSALDTSTLTVAFFKGN